MPDLSWSEEEFVFPAGLARGEAEVSCAIVGDDGKRAVRLAIKALDADGWHPLTRMDVL